MMLSDTKIVEEIGKGNILIEPFDPERLNPNSYNVTLHNELMMYDEIIIDPKKNNKTIRFEIPEEGFVIEPGKVYLGRIQERTRTLGHVPIIDGRSSIGRLGIFIHVTAGFGDNGFDGYFTLEIACLQPVRIYPGMEIGQIYYYPVLGESTRTYQGKYQGNNDIQASMMYKDFEKKNNTNAAILHGIADDMDKRFDESIKHHQPILIDKFHRDERKIEG